MTVDGRQLTALRGIELRCTIKIGELKVRFTCPSRAWFSFLRSEYRAFILPSASRAHAEIAIIDAPFPRASRLSVIHRDDRTEIRRYDFRSVSGRGLSRTELRVERDKYAFDSWLRVFVTCLGVRRRALLVHSAGYFHAGRTFLFPGRSGRGKSTMIRILGKPQALSDELTLLYLKGGKAWCAATPFWGELSRGTGRTSAGTLHGIYFLRHGKSEKLDRVDRQAAVRGLLKTVLFFDPSPERTGELLDLVSSVAAKVPAFDLAFAKSSPRPRLLDLVQRS